MSVFNLSYEYDRYFVNWLKVTGVRIMLVCNNHPGIITVSLNKEGDAPHIARHETGTSKTRSICGNGDPDVFWLAGKQEICKMVSINDSLVVNRRYFTSNANNVSIRGEKNGRLFLLQGDPPKIMELRDSHFRLHRAPIGDTSMKATGFCLKDGEPAYATIMGGDGGSLRDIRKGETLIDGLDHPRNPAWHSGNLYFLEAGSGSFCRWDGTSVRRMAFIPGYLNTLDFVADYAVIGCSLDKHEWRFKGTQLGERLRAEGMRDRCGIYVVDLKRGDICNFLLFSNSIREIRDIRVVFGT